MSDIYQALHNFVAMHDGRKVHVYQGHTTRVGHWLLDVYPAAFRPLVLDHDLEDASAEASEPAPAPEPVAEPVAEPEPAPVASGLTTDSLSGE